MEINWLGHSCFRLKNKDATIITDPFDETAGYAVKPLKADIVTVSHEHPRHSTVDNVEGDPKVLRGPGEYEIKGVFIYGIRTFRDSDQGKTKGKNTAYLIELDGVKICHLGDLGHALSAAQVEDMSDTDILLIPVGGVSTVDASTAAEVVNVIGPRIVIPMHYKTETTGIQLEPLDKFLKEMGVKEVSPIPKLNVNKSGLPDETQVVVLEHQE
ncbi:MAG: MBL fold metallo-hydrolase [Dehalococcoidia bacterium]